MPAAASDFGPSTSSFLLRKRKLDRVIDLTLNRSIGNMTSAKFKIRSTLNEMNYLSYAQDKKSYSETNQNSLGENSIAFSSRLPDVVGCMECDPKEGRCLLVSFAAFDGAIYDVSKDVGIFNQIVRLTYPRNPFDLNSAPHSIHWIWDGSLFTICSRNSINFFDSSTCEVLESVKFPEPVLNHVIAASKYSRNKYVAVTGFDGRVSIIDMRYGITTMTMPNIEKSPIRAIHWHPTNELQYVTGNDLGNIFLWDLRFQRKYIRKINNNDSFAPASSHSYPIIGLNFYHNGNSIMSIDYEGYIKTWNIYTGVKYPTYYEPVSFDAMDDHLRGSHYQFTTTDNLTQDVAFLPTNKGLRMFDINTGEHLLNSNDISVPLKFLTYDRFNMRVYSSYQDMLKVWAPDRTDSEPLSASLNNLD